MRECEAQNSPLTKIDYADSPLVMSDSNPTPEVQNKTSLSSNLETHNVSTIGLHPMAAAAILAVDSMLFGGTVATAGAAYALSIPVGIIITIAVTALQKSGCNDDWILASGKGVTFGLLTAIPTPLPSIITVSCGVKGYFAYKKNQNLISRVPDGSGV